MHCSVLFAVEFLHSRVAHMVGFAILLFVLTKLIVFPLQKRFFEGRERMRKLAPQLDELKQKFANDKERLSTETQKLYHDNNVNPVAPYLLMLLQLPIWFVAYWFLVTKILSP